jgi:hypothetical protein
MALSHLVKTTSSNHGWKVLYEEHGWKDKETSGFIDLVLEDKYRTWLMNVECKRGQETTWVFLVQRGAKVSKRRTKLWITKKSTEEMKSFSWYDIQMDPETYESSFCVVPGQDSKSRPMLERIAANVVSSTEALAIEEANILSIRHSNLRIYQNVIVTTAELKICEMDPAEVDLTNGRVKNANFIDVPFVRFRKQLSHASFEQQNENGVDEPRSLTNRKENTVFIVRALNFFQFLKECELPDNIGSYIQSR